MTITVRPTDRPMTSGVRRWDPFRELDEMYQHMNRMLQAIPTERTPAAITMADVEETDNAYIVDIDVPGVQPEDLNIELDVSDLLVTGEIKERKRQGHLRRRERLVGKFEHMISLPREVNPDKIEAKLHDGVLTVQIAKAKAEGPRRIEVQKA